jgi:ABC-type microcin C transport system duplicated ATPase subunit YejF
MGPDREGALCREVPVQVSLLALRELHAHLALASLFISDDLAPVSAMGRQLMVMYLRRFASCTCPVVAAKPSEPRDGSR